MALRRALGKVLAKFGKWPVCEMKSLRNCATLCVLLTVALLLYHDPFLLLWWPEKPAEVGLCFLLHAGFTCYLFTLIIPESSVIVFLLSGAISHLSLQRTQADGLPLDMATDSIDDMYDGCHPEMAAVIDLFGVFEWHFNKNFSIAWASAESSAKKPVHKHLKEEHATVIYIYTKVKNIQNKFNQAVKTGKHNYSTHNFKFHYFYFYLTDAIQILRQNHTHCRTTYHRTQKHFDTDVNNTMMRFGAFTWAASSKQPFDDSDGNVSCFEIYSCFGADITYYSATTQTGQLLIPPYEVFKITDVLTNEPWCSVVYKLQSTNVPRTVLNCKLDPRQMKSYFGDISAYWYASSVGIFSAGIILLIISSVGLVQRRQKRFVATVLGALQMLLIIVVLLKVIQ